MKNKFIPLVAFFIVLSSAAYPECWDLQEIGEIQGISELEGNIHISVKDAESCANVPGYRFEMAGKSYVADGKGYVKIPEAEADLGFDSRVPMKFSKEGYLNLELSVPVVFGQPKLRRFLMTRHIPAESARFVLSWGEKPRDLDLHLVGPDFHVSYRDKKSVPNVAKLDRDDTNGYGPETITLDKVKQGTEYKVFVRNYSGEADMNDEGVVQIYLNNKLKTVVYLSAGGKDFQIGRIVDKDWKGAGE